MNLRTRFLGFGRSLKRMAILALLVLIVFLAIHIFSGRQISPIDQIDDSSTVTPVAVPATKTDTVFADTPQPFVPLPAPPETNAMINTGKTDPVALVKFAETLVGVPYVYASSDPSRGFDCSGFITYVFNHFGIAVPRSSIDFTTVGKTGTIEDAKPGDLILFTGTNEYEKNIGHMGLIVSNDPVQGPVFIHASSGKAMAVTFSSLNDRYKKRFVRICRIFAQNG